MSKKSRKQARSRPPRQASEPVKNQRATEPSNYVSRLREKPVWLAAMAAAVVLIVAAVVLVESSGILPTLGAFALGFSTASQPSLPIQGSEKALHFFAGALRTGRQNFYLAGEDETAFSRICRSLQER